MSPAQVVLVFVSRGRCVRDAMLPPPLSHDASPIAPATTSESQEIKAILMSMWAVRQSVDQLAARQQQMANAIATLKATEQNILRKISSAPSARPAAAPARKPVPAPPRSPQEPPVR